MSALWTIDELAAAMRATKSGALSSEISGISIDSRTAAKGAAEIGDRAQAIHAGIAELKSGDVLLIAGKGHETGQIIGDKIVPFSDHDAVAAALQGKVA